MAEAALAHEDPAAPAAHPYPPRWLDRLPAWVRVAPGPWGLYYLALGAILAGRNVLAV